MYYNYNNSWFFFKKTFLGKIFIGLFFISYGKGNYFFWTLSNYFFQFTEWRKIMYIKSSNINKTTTEELFENLGITTHKDYVLRGWKRCRKLGISPFQKKCAKKFEGETLEKILRRNAKLISLSKPYIESLYSYVKGTCFSVVLSDSNACILELMFDDSVIENTADKINFTKGALWDEIHVGNNSLNTCLREGIPVQISGNEHYCIMNHDWTCTSAPIRNGDKIIGAIGVRGYKVDNSPHTLGMVVSTAKAIETSIEMEHTKIQLILKSNYENALVKCISSGLMTIDASGIVKYMNDIGAEILKVNKEASIDRPITNVVDFHPVILDVFKNNQGYIEREFVVKNTQGIKLHFVKSANIIRDEMGNTIGVIDIFRKIDNTNNKYKNITSMHAKYHFDDIIGKSNTIKKSIKLAKIASKSSSNVLIQGESGTGKELFAESIHNASDRKDHPFISINCAAIPSELIESELFGYSEGAFTGALKGGHPGKFELANGGTIFLDEIGDMPLYMQAKLLRVLQEKQITRIGGNSVLDIDTRIICATNKELLAECHAGNFRKDLYYRLNVLNIYLPPLRKRKEDIKELLYYFINKMNAKMNKNIRGISKEAIEYIIEYEWPGNVRELENCIERAVNLCESTTITLKDLAINIREKKIMSNLRRNSFNRLITLNENTGEDKIESLESIEIKEIKRALQIMDGNISQTANILKISRNTLYNKMKKYNIQLNDIEKIHKFV
ncbi:AAA domain-containing protein [Clostridium sp. HV4-5-A1G]|nr:AAA domain-containing protein [Clostridium sp. HV4-5-A1G]